MNTNVVFWIQNQQSNLDQALFAILNRSKNFGYVRGSNSQYALCDEYILSAEIKEQAKKGFSPIIVDVPLGCIPYSLSGLDERYTPFFIKIEGYIPLCERGKKKIFLIRGNQEYFAQLLTTYDGHNDGVLMRSPLTAIV